jgi:threonine dehydrogenase-like Zn-dependent dehydrogenase
MPRELVAIAPHKPAIQAYDDPPLTGNEIRLRTEFAAPKHGTELAIYRGESAFTRGDWREDFAVFVPKETPQAPHFPMRLGNMAVGIVTDVGPEVTQWKLGDRLFGHMPIRETQTVPETRLHAVPDGMAPEAIVYLDPAEFALGAVRDANIRLGDTVAVFGMGAIGLMAAQMARLSGAEWVAVIDPIPLRREAALKHGADAAYNPNDVDVALEIKTTLPRPGVDVAIEASGAYRALHEAIRCTHFGGRVVPLAFYCGDAKGLWLGEEWHMNRIDMISTRACSDPNRDHPMWDDRRIIDTAFRLLRDGKLGVEGLVTPIVAIDDSADAYRDIDEHPERSIKMGVRF